MGHPETYMEGADEWVDELVRSVLAGMAGRLGIEIVQAGPETVTGRMPVAGNTMPYGFMHGGASCVLAETLGTVGAAIYAGADRRAVGIEIGATHHRAVSSGQVTGIATRVHGGRSVATYEIVITDDLGSRICTARLTCMLRDFTGQAPARG